MMMMDVIDRESKTDDIVCENYSAISKRLLTASASMVRAFSFSSGAWTGSDTSSSEEAEKQQNQAFHRRASLRTNADFLLAVNQLWGKLPKTLDGRLRKRAYLGFYQRAVVTLTEATTRTSPLSIMDDLECMAERDWTYDLQGAHASTKAMDYLRFLDSIFEFCDLVAPGIHARQSVELVTKITRCIMIENTDLGTLPFKSVEDIESLVFDAHASTEDVQCLEITPAHVATYSIKQMLVVQHHVMYPNSEKTSLHPMEEDDEVQSTDSNERGIEVPKIFNHKSIHPRKFASASDVWTYAEQLQQRAVVEPVGISIIGPRLSGKTTLARALASHLKFEYISEITVLEQIIEANAGTGKGLFCGFSTIDETQICAQLEQGQAVDKVIINQCLLLRFIQVMQSGKSYVLDDVSPDVLQPCQLSNVLSSVIDSSTCCIPATIQFDCVIELQLSPQDVANRFTGCTTDFSTGFQYSSRDQCPEGDITRGFLNQVQEKPSNEIDEAGQEKRSSSEEEEEDGVEDDGDIEEPVVKHALFPILQRPVPNTLFCVKDTALDENQLNTDDYFKYQQERMKTNLPLVKSYYEVSAIQSPSKALEQILKFLSGRCPVISQLPQALQANALSVTTNEDETEDQVSAEEEPHEDRKARIQEIFQSTKGRLRWSSFHDFCPVQYFKDQSFQRGLVKYPVQVGRYLFLCASAQARDQFVAFPRQYLKHIPMYTYPKTQHIVCFSDAPSDAVSFTNPTSIQQDEVDFYANLRNELNVDVINFQEYLENQVEQNEEMRETLVSGGMLSNVQLSEIMERCLKEKVSERGWILTQVPLQAMEQLLPIFQKVQIDYWLSLTASSSPASVTEKDPDGEEKLNFKMIQETVGATVLEVALNDAPFEFVIQHMNPLLFRSEIAAPEEFQSLADDDENLEEPDFCSWGTFLEYCPVTWYQNHVLVAGNPELCLKVNQERYCFVSEEALAKFQEFPIKYLGGSLKVFNPSRMFPNTDHNVQPLVFLLGSARSLDLMEIFPELIMIDMTSCDQSQRLDPEAFDRTDWICQNLQDQFQQHFAKQKKMAVFMPQLYFQSIEDLTKCLDVLATRHFLPTVIVPVDCSAPAKIQNSDTENEENDVPSRLLPEDLESLASVGKIPIFAPLSIDGFPHRVSKRWKAYVREHLYPPWGWCSENGNVQNLTQAQASSRLEAGLATLSRDFGLRCPVKAQCKTSDQSTDFPLQIQDVIYFPHSVEARAQMLSKSLSRSGKISLMLPKLWILGESSSALAQALSHVYSDVPLVTLDSALEWFQQCAGDCVLWHFLCQEEKDDCRSKLEILSIYLSTLTEGYILHDIPFTLATKALDHKGSSSLRPHGYVVVAPEVSESEALTFELKCHTQFGNVGAVITVNVPSSATQPTTTMSWSVVRQVTEHVQFQLLAPAEEFAQVMTNTSMDIKATSMISVRCSAAELEAQYPRVAICPVTRVHSRALVQDRDLWTLVEDKNNAKTPLTLVACDATTTRDQFCHDPASWLVLKNEDSLKTPEAECLLEDLTINYLCRARVGVSAPADNQHEPLMMMTTTTTPEQVLLFHRLTSSPAAGGYCIVTWTHDQTLVKGHPFFAVSLVSTREVLLFQTQEAKDTFLRSPDTYIALSKLISRDWVLKTPLPRTIQPQRLENDDPTTKSSRFTRDFSHMIERGLVQLGHKRLKYPQRSIEASSCVFLALWLRQAQAQVRAQTPKVCQTSVHQYQDHKTNVRTGLRCATKTLEAFEHDCTLSANVKSTLFPVGSAKNVILKHQEGESSSSTRAMMLERFDALFQVDLSFPQ